MKDFPWASHVSWVQAMLNYVQETEAEQEKLRNVKTWIILKNPLAVHSNPPPYSISSSHSQKGATGERKCSDNPNDRLGIPTGVVAFSASCGRIQFLL